MFGGVQRTKEQIAHIKSPSGLGPMDKFVNLVSPKACLSSDKDMNDELFKQRSEAVREYICRWIYEAGIPFDSLELDSFKLMIEAIGQSGPGYVAPTRYDLSEPLLKKEVDRTKSLLKTHEEEWKSNGCSIIITNDWSVTKRRNIVNLFVNSSSGTVFLSSKSFSNTAHTTGVIFQYVDRCIEKVGLDNVVQIVTDNAEYSIGVADLMKEKKPKIFWTSSAAHTIDLMLESIAKQPRFKKVIDQAKALTVFLYAHHKVLALMRSHTKKKNIVRPGVTRIVSTYLTLQSLHDKRVQLKAMFGSPGWEDCKFSKSAKGKSAYTTVMSIGFWSGVALCLQVFAPLIKVHRTVDGDRRPTMGFVYGELVEAKKKIQDALSNLPKNYEAIIEVIDAHIKDRLDSPLHLMAYVLNPYYHYKSSLLHLDHEIMSAVMECLDVWFPRDFDLKDKILCEEFLKYKEKESIFGEKLTMRPVRLCYVSNAASAEFDPVTWWSDFGGITPNLQRLAMRILSLTTSSFGCERNWSAFKEECTKERSILDRKLRNNLVFVQFNARLLSKQKRDKNESDVEVLFSHDSTYAEEWIVDDDDDNVGDVGGGHMPPISKKRRIEELYEGNFESDNENEVEYESDGDRIFKD